MKKRSQSKLWIRANKHLRRETAEYAKILETLNLIHNVILFRAQFADVIETQEILSIALEPPSQFERWKRETKRVKKLTNALARLILGRDKSKCPDAEPKDWRGDGDIPFC